MTTKKDTTGSQFREAVSQLQKNNKNKLDEEKTLTILKYRNLLKAIDTISAILGVAGISIEYYLTQILFYGSPQYQITNTYNVLCVINIVLTVILLLLIVYHYFIRNKLINVKKSNLESEAFNSHLILSLIIELIICCITSLPNVNTKFTGSMRGATFVYHITDIIMLISLLRCYLILRLYEHYSKWTSHKSAKICKKYGTTADVFFALKSDLKDRPFLSIGVALTLLVILFGVATMQAEKSYSGKVNGMDQLTNAEWLTIITMATVGYGDFYPTTHLGRFFCLLSCISGMILVSAMVVALNVSSEFDKDQSIAYLAIRAKEREQEWLSSAANAIKSAFRSAKCPLFSKAKFESILRLRNNIHIFKRKTQLNSLMDMTSAEMLYDLQHKLEEKLLATKSIIFEIPNLRERCEKMKAKQNILDSSIEKIMKQQEEISECFKTYQNQIGNGFSHIE